MSTKLCKRERLVLERDELQQQIIEQLGQGWDIVQEEFQRLLALKGLTRNITQIISLNSIGDDVRRTLINVEYLDYPLVHAQVSDILILPVSKMQERLEELVRNSIANIKMLTGESYDRYMELECKKMGITTHLSKYK